MSQLTRITSDMLPRYANVCAGKRYWKRNHWSITRLFSKNETANNDDINNYLSTLGYTDSSMKNGMRDALQTVFGNQITLSQVKGFGEEGMSHVHELCDSISYV